MQPTLVRGAGATFDVHVDGRLVYSKFKTHQLPDEATLVVQLRDVAKSARP